MAKAKTKAASIRVPQTREEAAQFVHDIGCKQRMLKRIETKMGDEIAAATQAAEYEASPHQAALKNLTEGLRIWADANRAELTNDGRRKSVNLGTGVISWRDNPPSVNFVKGWKVAQVVDLLKRIRLGKYIRRKEEVDKEAILAAPAKDVEKMREGVVVKSAGEVFSVEPFEAEIEGAE